MNFAKAAPSAPVKKAARENLSAVIATLEHALRMMAAEGH